LVILVTGGSGFIGSHIVDALLERDHEVRVFDLTKPHNDDAKWFRGDLTNRDDVFHAFRDVEFAFHLGAIADVDVALSNPGLCLRVNELGTLHVLEAAQSVDAERVLLASTTWVYGNTKGIATEETPLPPPEHIYTKMKMGQEQLLMAWNRHHGLPYTILRYDIPYGPRMRENLAIAVLVRKAMRGEPLTIHGDGNQGRCFIFVNDLAEGNLAALGAKATNQIINLAGSQFITIEQAVEELRQMYGDVRVIRQPPRAVDFKGVLVSTEKAEELLGWTPKTRFAEGLRKYVEWAKTRDRSVAQGCRPD
jgi:UDP-glucose 4-epimerase